MTKQEDLIAAITATCSTWTRSVISAFNEVTVEADAACLLPLLYHLRDSEALEFNQLIDLCAVDYLYYGKSDWETNSATESGFSRAVAIGEFSENLSDRPRFAVVYHMLSTTNNHRLRLRVYLDDENLILPSVHEVWPVANWFEREAYDLYGVLFEGHPDLRRILTDYGFIGHPFRKDFPLSGHVEMRYDAATQKVLYVPVDVVPRLSGPKVIRTHDPVGGLS